MARLGFNIVLSERRYDLGLTVGQAAGDLGLSRDVLYAFENGDFARMPAEPEARRALEAYARYLGLDANTIVSEYDRAVRGDLSADGEVVGLGGPMPARAGGRERAAGGRDRVAGGPAIRPRAGDRDHAADDGQREGRAGQRRERLPSRRALVASAIVLLLVIIGSMAAVALVTHRNAEQQRQAQAQAAAQTSSGEAAPEPSVTNAADVLSGLDQASAPADPQVDANMTAKAQDQQSDTEWLILVDCTANRMGIFRGERGHWEGQEFVTVSTGAENGQDTIKGTFSVQDRGESFNGFDETFRAYYTCYYWTRFEGPYLFHSQPYHLESFDLMDPRIGQNVSQGCVRMPIEKAQWIYENIPIGTAVLTY